MGRRPKIQRSAEEKSAIVMEGLKSGKVSETCVNLNPAGSWELFGTKGARQMRLWRCRLKR